MAGRRAVTLRRWVAVVVGLLMALAAGVWLSPAARGSTDVRFAWSMAERFGLDDDGDGLVCAGIVEADTAIQMLQTAKSCIAAFEHSIGAGFQQAAAGRPADTGRGHWRD